MDADLKEPQKKLESAVEFFKKEIQTLRTGRPSLSLLENVKISYYGNPSSVDKVASLNIMDNRIIVISPWDMKMIPEIEKAIMAANIGLTPQNDGKVIRIVVPPMTEERRKQMVKLLKKMAEDAKIAIRNIRRDGNDELKKKKSDGLIQEDRLKKLQDELQKITDQTVQKVDDLTQKKEQEIMTT
jgi:ribosome recycling factor